MGRLNAVLSMLILMNCAPAVRKHWNAQVAKDTYQLRLAFSIFGRPYASLRLIPGLGAGCSDYAVSGASGSFRIKLAEGSEKTIELLSPNLEFQQTYMGNRHDGKDSRPAYCEAFMSVTEWRVEVKEVKEVQYNLAIVFQDHGKADSLSNQGAMTTGEWQGLWTDRGWPDTSKSKR